MSWDWCTLTLVRVNVHSLSPVVCLCHSTSLPTKMRHAGAHGIAAVPTYASLTPPEGLLR